MTTLRQKPGTNCPTLHPGVVYSITINPDDKRQRFMSPDKTSSVSHKDRLKAFGRLWHGLFTEYFSMNETDYYLQTECSFNLVTGPRLHFHGYIRFQSTFAIREFLCITARALLSMCNLDIDTIGQTPEDWEEWKSYTHKDTYLGWPTFENMPPNFDSLQEWMFPPNDI